MEELDTLAGQIDFLRKDLVQRNITEFFHLFWSFFHQKLTNVYMRNILTLFCGDLICYFD